MTVRLVSENLDFVTPVPKDRVNLRHLVKKLYAQARPPVDGMVLLTQETKNLRLVAVLRWVGHHIHRGLFARYVPLPLVMQGRGPAKSGTAIAAYGVTLRRLHLFLGGRSRATLPRWVTKAWLQMPSNVLELFSAHVPPPRAGDNDQLRYLRKLRRRLARVERRGHGWAACGDFNRNIGEVARILGGRVVQGSTQGGIGIIVSAHVVVSDSGRDTYGVRHKDTDHPAVWCDVDDVKAAA